MVKAYRDISLCLYKSAHIQNLLNAAMTYARDVKKNLKSLPSNHNLNINTYITADKVW
jgi:hypothetical protein